MIYNVKRIMGLLTQKLARTRMFMIFLNNYLLDFHSNALNIHTRNSYKSIKYTGGIEADTFSEKVIYNNERLTHKELIKYFAYILCCTFLFMIYWNWIIMVIYLQLFTNYLQPVHVSAFLFSWICLKSSDDSEIG